MDSFPTTRLCVLFVLLLFGLISLASGNYCSNKGGRCIPCTWETRVRDCGRGSSCWSKVPGCGGEPAGPRGYCANEEWGKCTRCTATDSPTTCGAPNVCWEAVNGCGSNAPEHAPGFCAGLPFGQCRKCAINMQCASGRCDAGVIGCFSTNPEGNVWIPPLWKSNNNIFYKCMRSGDVALTFDDGPLVPDSERVLDVLREVNAVATFFVTGVYVNAQSGPVLTRMEREGHTVASHTVNHLSMTRERGPSVAAYLENEVDENERIMAPYLPQKGLRRYMRPPYLDMDESMAYALGRIGYKVVQTNLDTKDFDPQITDALVARTFEMTLSDASPQEHSFISLQHDDYAENHLRAIRRAVRVIRQKGFNIVSMGQCVGPTGSGPKGGPIPEEKQKFCSNEPFGRCTVCSQSSDCENGDCWDEYPGCGDRSDDEPIGYCSDSSAVGQIRCAPCLWSNHCGANEPQGACLTSHPRCSTPQEAMRDTIAVCYRILGTASTSIPVSDGRTYPHRYNVRVDDCPSGWHPAAGTVYSSWPAPGTTECADDVDGGYNGCKWAGLFKNVDAGPGFNCRPGAQRLPRPDGGDVRCRWPRNLVRSWNVASTWDGRPDLLNRRVEVRLASSQRLLGEFNMVDVCSDDDCNGCCRRNTGGGSYPLLDMEVSGYCKGMGCNPDTIDITQLDHPPNTWPVFPNQPPQEREIDLPEGYFLLHPNRVCQGNGDPGESFGASDAADCVNKCIERDEEGTYAVFYNQGGRDRCTCPKSCRVGSRSDAAAPHDADTGGYGVYGKQLRVIIEAEEEEALAGHLGAVLAREFRDFRIPEAGEDQRLFHLRNPDEETVHHPEPVLTEETKDVRRICPPPGTRDEWLASSVYKAHESAFVIDYVVTNTRHLGLEFDAVSQYLQDQVYTMFTHSDTFKGYAAEIIPELGFRNLVSCHPYLKRDPIFGGPPGDPLEICDLHRDRVTSCRVMPPLSDDDFGGTLYGRLGDLRNEVRKHPKRSRIKIIEQISGEEYTLAQASITLDTRLVRAGPRPLDPGLSGFCQASDLLRAILGLPIKFFSPLSWPVGVAGVTCSLTGLIGSSAEARIASVAFIGSESPADVDVVPRVSDPENKRQFECAKCFDEDFRREITLEQRMRLSDDCWTFCRDDITTDRRNLSDVCIVGDDGICE